MPEVLAGRARYRRILRFAAWHLGTTWWYEILLPSIGLRRVAERTRTARIRRFARKFRALAVDLGGLMIKLGQFMSSRLDVLPPEITKELEGLQDEVPAVPFPAIHDLAEAELGLPLNQVFASIDETPIAAASLGQVYRAVLSVHDAAETGFSAAVIKVQRPGIGAIIAVDLAALRKVGGWLSRVGLVSRRVDAPAVVEEFAQTSLEEIDYLLEASHSERFAANFAEHDRVRVPAVAWERTTRRVLTLEDVTAIKITDVAALRAAGIDPAAVAKAFAEIMFDQLFLHGFFHADPHPGNLFVTPAPPGQDAGGWRLTFVDFGMMGVVPTSLRATLRGLVIAAAARDGKAMVNAMAQVGVLLPSADTVELEKVMSTLFARFGGMGFAELRQLDPKQFHDFAVEFSDVVLSLPFQLPENFLLIIRAVSLTSGVSSSLDPAYNLWDTVEPYAEQLLRDEGGNLLADVGKQAVDTIGVLWRMPARLDAVLTQVEDGTLPLSAPRLEREVARLEVTGRRLVSTGLFSGLIIAGAVVRSDDPNLGTWLMIAAGLPLLHALFAGRRFR